MLHGHRGLPTCSMCRASPVTTVSVTARSGWSEVPDFSAYFRAYAHILSTLAAEGSFMPPPRLRRRAQGCVDLGRIEAREPLVADEEHWKGHETERHQLFARAGITADVSLSERDPLLR